MLHSTSVTVTLLAVSCQIPQSHTMPLQPQRHVHQRYVFQHPQSSSHSSCMPCEKASGPGYTLLSLLQS
jgi:hypothetical protein